jgi:hypothetical protein
MRIVIAVAGVLLSGTFARAPVVAAKSMYAPVIDPRTGTALFAGLDAGSEMHWAAISGQQPDQMSNDPARFFVIKDSDNGRRGTLLSLPARLAQGNV